jgi:hypothetical protein
MVDLRQLTDLERELQMAPTKAVYFEPLSNPNLDMVDVAKVRYTRNCASCRSFRKFRLSLCRMRSPRLHFRAPPMQVCSLARAAGAKVLIDNAFLTPALLRPLALCTPPTENGDGGEICGADVIIHSSTKFLSVRLARARAARPHSPTEYPSTRVPEHRIPRPPTLVLRRT